MPKFMLEKEEMEEPLDMPCSVGGMRKVYFPVNTEIAEAVKINKPVKVILRGEVKMVSEREMDIELESVEVTGMNEFAAMSEEDD